LRRKGVEAGLIFISRGLKEDGAALRLRSDSGYAGFTVSGLRIKMRGFHGTDGASAIAILREGVQEYSFWAYELKWALRYGGCHVFIADFEVYRDDGWQFLNGVRILPEDLRYQPPH